MEPCAEKEALWHMVHDDGDEEDLEAHEVKLAMKCFNQKLERSEAKEKGLLFEVAKL